MPNEPKKKHSKARKRTRRASIKLAQIGLQKCSNCREEMIPHQICKACGFYAGKKVQSKTGVTITKA